MTPAQDYLPESRNAVAVLTALHSGNPAVADQCLKLVQDPAKYITALQGLAVQFLKVIDQLAIASGIPEANGAELLSELRHNMAMSDGIEI